MPSIIKVTDLVELTTPADGDFIPIVDISEPLEIDKTKRISYLNLIISKITAAIAPYLLSYKRQGGNSTDWTVSGTTNYDLTGVMIQTGSINLNITTPQTGYYVGSATITFPVSFSQKPLIFINPISVSSVALTFTYVSSVNNVSIVGRAYDASISNIDISWLAIGKK